MEEKTKTKKTKKTKKTTTTTTSIWKCNVCFFPNNTTEICSLCCTFRWCSVTNPSNINTNTNINIENININTNINININTDITRVSVGLGNNTHCYDNQNINDANDNSSSSSSSSSSSPPPPLPFLSSPPIDSSIPIPSSPQYYPEIQHKYPIWSKLIPNHYELCLLLKEYCINNDIVTLKSNSKLFDRNSNVNRNNNNNNNDDDDDDSEDSSCNSDTSGTTDSNYSNEKKKKISNNREKIEIDYIVLNIALYCYRPNEPMFLNYKNILNDIVVNFWNMSIEYYIFDIIIEFIGGMQWNPSILSTYLRQQIHWAHSNGLACFNKPERDFINLCTNMPIITDRILINIFVLQKGDEIWLGLAHDKHYQPVENLEQGSCNVFYYGGRESRIIRKISETSSACRKLNAQFSPTIDSVEHEKDSEEEEEEEEEDKILIEKERIKEIENENRKKEESSESEESFDDEAVGKIQKGSSGRVKNLPFYSRGDWISIWVDVNRNPAICWYKNGILVGSQATLPPEKITGPKKFFASPKLQRQEDNINWDGIFRICGPLDEFTDALFIEEVILPDTDNRLPFLFNPSTGVVQNIGALKHRFISHQQVAILVDDLENI